MPHTDILNAVVDTNADVILLTHPDIFCHVVAVRRGQRHLVAHFLSIDINGGLDVRPFQEERDALFLPRFRHVDGTLVPGSTHVMVLRSQEEGELHLSFHTIFLHVGIEVERRVIERAGPLRLSAHGVALAVGQHGAGQHDVVVVLGGVANGEVPCPDKINDLLGIRHGELGNEK